MAVTYASDVSDALKDELRAIPLSVMRRGGKSSGAYSNWQKSPSFTGLSPDTVYTFYAKYDTG